MRSDGLEVAANLRQVGGQRHEGIAERAQFSRLFCSSLMTLPSRRQLLGFQYPAITPTVDIASSDQFVMFLNSLLQQTLQRRQCLSLFGNLPDTRRPG